MTDSRKIKPPPKSMTVRNLAESTSVECPACGNRTGAVLDSRPSDGTIRRRRICGACHLRFSTYEVYDVEGVLTRKTVARLMQELGKIKNVVDYVERFLVPQDAQGADSGD